MLFGKLKLTSKLAVIIGAVLAVIFALLIGVTISTTSTSIQKGIAGELSALARTTGTEIQDSFGVVDDTARGIQEYIGRIYAKPNGAPGDAAAMQQSTLYPGLSLTSTLGTAAIAANAVANTTTTFLNIPANAVGMAALTVVGQCLGAGEKEQSVYYSRRLLLTAYCGAWVMNLSAFLFANRFAISLFNLSPEAQTMALQVMVWFNFVSLFFWPSSFTLPNILRAAGDARFTMAVSILSMWVFRVGFCYVMVLGFHGRLLSIWMGMFLDWVFRSLCFFVRFARGRWMEQSVI